MSTNNVITNNVMYDCLDMIESYDPELLTHSNRVAVFSVKIAACLKFERTEALLQGALLHDIGKTGLDKDILQRKGNLSPHDWHIIHCHPIKGLEILAGKGLDVEQLSGSVLFHHERWDGAGYFRIPGHQIPLEAQIVSLADAIEAMSSNRVYRKALTPDEILCEVEKGKGYQFNPELVSTLEDNNLLPQLMKF